VATGGVLINPSNLIDKSTQQPIDHAAVEVLQVATIVGETVLLVPQFVVCRAIQYVLLYATQNFDPMVIFSTVDI
jgi:hypothetical protein